MYTMHDTAQVEFLTNTNDAYISNKNFFPDTTEQLIIKHKLWFTHIHYIILIAQLPHAP